MRWTAAVLLLAGSQDGAPWKDSWAKAADFLVKGQGDDGLWLQEMQGKKRPSMALTVLCVDALARMPAELRRKHQAAIDKGVAVILKTQDPKDGGWSEPPGMLRAYVTSLAVMALCAHDREKHKDAIDKAEKFLIDLQKKEGFYLGSTGYGEKTGRNEQTFGDMGNTAKAAEALHDAGCDDQEYWKNVVEFLTKCQNNSERNIDPEWLKQLEQHGYKVGNDGGFYYAPALDGAEERGAGVAPDGDKKVLASYGTMSYEGLKTYIYAGLKPDDPRVKAAVDWARKNYTLERHPGFPYEKEMPAAKRKDNQGLYYYYMAMARALDAFGEDPFVTDDGKKHDWRKEIADKLVSLQKPDGSWVNEQVRWWEGDPLLVTPYVLKIYAVLEKKDHGK